MQVNYQCFLTVGTVAEVSEAGVTVQPSVDLARLTEALVLDYGVEGILPAPEDMPVAPAVKPGEAAQ